MPPLDPVDVDELPEEPPELLVEVLPDELLDPLVDELPEDPPDVLVELLLEPEAPDELDMPDEVPPELLDEAPEELEDPEELDDPEVLDDVLEEVEELPEELAVVASGPFTPGSSIALKLSESPAARLSDGPANAAVERSAAAAARLRRRAIIAASSVARCGIGSCMMLMDARAQAPENGRLPMGQGRADKLTQLKHCRRGRGIGPKHKGAKGAPRRRMAQTEPTNDPAARLPHLDRVDLHFARHRLRDALGLAGTARPASG